MRSYLDYLIRVGFVVLSSVGLTPGRSEWPRRMKGRKKPDQLVNAQNKNPGFVVQIPEGLYANCQNNFRFHPLIAPKNQK